MIAPVKHRDCLVAAPCQTRFARQTPDCLVAAPVRLAPLVSTNVDCFMRGTGQTRSARQAPGCLVSAPARHTDRFTTPRGFEPLRAEPNGFLVNLLGRSDTVSVHGISEPTANQSDARLGRWTRCRSVQWRRPWMRV